MHYVLQIDHKAVMESMKVDSCVQRAQDIAKSEKEATKRASQAPTTKKEEGTVGTRKDKPKGDRFEKYMARVKAITKKMKDVDGTPKSIAAAANKLFNVKLDASYLSKAPNAGIMKMRACNRIASELGKSENGKARKTKSR
jgi:hypothetical protein